MVWNLSTCFCSSWGIIAREEESDFLAESSETESMLDYKIYRSVIFIKSMVASGTLAYSKGSWSRLIVKSVLIDEV